MKKITNRREKRESRRTRVRASVKGTSAKPRLNVFRSLKKIYAQLIDDDKGRTLVSADSREIKNAKKPENYKGKARIAYLVGLELSKRAKEKNITAAVFDRAGYRYHGRVKALAEGAREGGLIF